MKPFLELQPTEHQSFRIIGHGARGNLAARLEASFEQAATDFERACAMRAEAFVDIISTFPDDEQTIVELDRNHPNTFAAMRTICFAAIDNFLAGDFDNAAAQLELLLDCDSEDPLEATQMLALCYIGLGEWDSFESVEIDLGDKSPILPLGRAIISFEEQGTVDKSAVQALARFREFAAEFKATEHPTDESYLQDISSENPSRAALARELYLQSEIATKNYQQALIAIRQALG